MNNIKFYRVRYDRLCLMLLVITILLLLLNIGIFSRLAFRGSSEYYATNMQGALYHLTPLNSSAQKI